MSENKVIRLNDKIEISDSVDIKPMTEEQVDELMIAIGDNVDDHIKAQREAAEQVEYKPDAELESEKVCIDVDKAIRYNQEGLIETDMSIFDIEEGKLDESNEEAANQAAITAATTTFDLTDEESLEMFQVIVNYRKDEKYPAYKNLPEKVKEMVRKTCAQEGIPLSNANMVARLFLDEFISEAAIDKEFVDLQKAIDEALSIPSISDLYSEHIDMVMNDKIPAYIEELRESGNDKKADMLVKVREAYEKAYNMSAMKETYLTSARARKMVRKHYYDSYKSCDELNMLNAKTKFKMDDANNMHKALNKVLIHDEEWEEDLIPVEAVEGVDKFIVLFCESCFNLDPENIVDATYMYYGLKNIIALGFTDEAKTDFALQLINNIKDMIKFIQDEEAKINATNNSEQKRKRKRSLKSRDKKLC